VTLVFALVMAVVLTAVGLFLYLRLAAQLDESLETALRSRATEVAALARDGGGGLEAAGSNPLVEQDESFAQLLAPNGNVVDSTPQVAGTAVLERSQAEAAMGGASFSERSSLPGIEGEVRMLAAPVDVGGRTLIAIVGSSVDDRDEALGDLASLLLIGGPAALVLASAACWLMVGAALRPVDAMRGRAAEISASEPGARLPLSEADDELRRLGETLNEMLGRLEDALERERRFVDDASHELRTPLALHKTELELALLHARDEAELRAAIASAADEIDRLIALAEQLLVVARNEDGERRVDCERFAVEDALAAIRARFAGRAGRAGRTLDIEVSPEATVLTADRLRVEQALTNLVDNALVHGAGAIKLVARSNAGSIELHVTDEGPGIPVEFIDRAFERFSRPDGARADGGTGLGLAVVESIARAHDGSAHARNRPDGGADVWVELPVVA
jgi:signal transduction histidine kinase